MSSEGQSTVQLHAAMLTDVGVVRDHNEDFAHIDPSQRFFIVADGMGGHAAGEVASEMAVDSVRQALEQISENIDEFAQAPDEDRRKQLIEILEDAVRSAHEAVYERGTRETDKHGMGTTLDVVLVAGPEAFVAHVGDSRTYLIREGRAAQITTDHTVAEVLVIEGKLSLEEAQISPLRTILVNAIGVAPEVGIEMAHLQLRDGDQLLLCSDGLHDYFPVEQELADYISKSSPEQALGDLVSLAKERGGHDNITGIVVHVESCNAGDKPARSTGTKSDGDTGPVKSELKESGVPGSIEHDDTEPVSEETLDEDAPDEDATETAEQPGDEKPSDKSAEDTPEGSAEAASEDSANPPDELSEEFGPGLFEEPTLEHERPENWRIDKQRRIGDGDAPEDADAGDDDAGDDSDG